jgi:GTP-binding protein
LRIDATFVRSAVSAEDFPHDGTAEVAFVGRSNVGKSTLINALARRRVARVSAAPGKTRLANIYRVEREGAAPLYLVDLPGYGFARGGSSGFGEIVTAFFDSVRLTADTTNERHATIDVRSVRLQADRAALLLVDARHPGLASDRHAWEWLATATNRRAAVATKIDKLARGERIRALREFESVLECPVVAVSAATGEGLDELANNRNSSRRSSQPRSSPPAATALRRKN